MSIHIPDPRPFGKDWYLQPLVIRFHSARALRVGLQVQVELRPLQGHSNFGVEQKMITWHGSKAQFLATGLLSASKFPTRVGGSRWTCPNELRGTLEMVAEDEYIYSIEWAYQTTKIREGRHADAARIDEAFLNFRDAVMAGFPLAGLEETL